MPPRWFRWNPPLPTRRCLQSSTGGGLLVWFPCRSVHVRTRCYPFYFSEAGLALPAFPDSLGRGYLLGWSNAKCFCTWIGGYPLLPSGKVEPLDSRPPVQLRLCAEFCVGFSPGVCPDAGCSMDGSETSPATDVRAEGIQGGPVEATRGLGGSANALCACRRNTVGSLAVVDSRYIIPGAHHPRRPGRDLAMDLPSCGKGSLCTRGSGVTFTNIALSGCFAEAPEAVKPVAFSEFVMSPALAYDLAPPWGGSFALRLAQVVMAVLLR